MKLKIFFVEKHSLYKINMYIDSDVEVYFLLPRSLQRCRDKSTMSVAGASVQDDARLHCFSREGRLDKIREYIDSVDPLTLEDRLNNRRGVFGYTPLHEAVNGGYPDALEMLLNKGGDINSRANTGYTPLHLASSAGNIECVRVLLRYNANIAAKDDYQKTPRQTAALSSKANIVKLLISEGQSSQTLRFAVKAKVKFNYFRSIQELLIDSHQIIASIPACTHTLFLAFFQERSLHCHCTHRHMTIDICVNSVRFT